MRGIVAWFSSEKGFGFIEPLVKGPDVFCHWSELTMDGYRKVYKGDRVEFEIGTDSRTGKLVAKNVRVLEAANGSRAVEHQRKHEC